MQSDPTLAYFKERVAQESHAAEHAGSIEARRAHLLMATLYQQSIDEILNAKKPLTAKS